MAGTRDKDSDMAKRDTDKDLTFEQARAELESIITAIEQGKFGLEEMIAQSERAKRLHDHCKRILTEAEARIQRLQLADDGTPLAVPMEPPPDESAEE
jgi:exodeoxyribonuclease VII small subunit